MIDLHRSHKNKKKKNQQQDQNCRAATMDDGFKEEAAPPNDDVCPICFGDFSLACRSNCGHWFCGSCILQVWNYGSAFQPCKCPMCCRHIKSLTPEASVYQHNETEAKTVLKAVGKYNRLFVGGTHGFILKFCEAPLLVERMLREMTDPDQADAHILKWRFFSMMLGLLYLLSPFNFIPPDVDVLHVCNCSAMILVALLKLVGFFRRRRSAQRARQIAAAEAVVGL